MDTGRDGRRGNGSHRSYEPECRCRLISTLEPVSYCAAMDLALRYALCYSMIQ